VLDAELRPETFLDLALRALPREDDELNVQRVLSYVSQDYWKFLPEAERSARAPRVERVLHDGLAAAKTTSLKGAYFAAVRNVAVTPPTVSWLTRVWSGEEAVPGLVLAETDFIVLSQELAVRGVPKWETILQQQVERTRNPDRKSRLQFVIPALSSDPAERDRFFTSLADVSNRRHEPWVLDGLRYLHHPLRAERSIAYVRPSLELLQEIQRTGDIFFPSRWMDATLGGHRSPESARTVRSFLERAGPSYPDRLRRIILSSADDLFRASGQRQRP
jgi:aminopeptidase N